MMLQNTFARSSPAAEEWCVRAKWRVEAESEVESCVSGTAAEALPRSPALSPLPPPHIPCSPASSLPVGASITLMNVAA
jgi:hypothetical protein